MLSAESSDPRRYRTVEVAAGWSIALRGESSDLDGENWEGSGVLVLSGSGPSSGRPRENRIESENRAAGSGVGVKRGVSVTSGVNARVG